LKQGLKQGISTTAEDKLMTAKKIVTKSFILPDALNIFELKLGLILRLNRRWFLLDLQDLNIAM
jgi:hypothetical protein